MMQYVPNFKQRVAAAMDNLVNFDNLLSDAGACLDGRVHCKGKTLSQAWLSCENPNLMTWWLLTAAFNKDRELWPGVATTARQDETRHLLLAIDRTLYAVTTMEQRYRKNGTHRIAFLRKKCYIIRRVFAMNGEPRP